MVCCVYSLDCLDEVILMSTHNIHFYDKKIKENFPEISLNICFLELSNKFPRDS